MAVKKIRAQALLRPSGFGGQAAIDMTLSLIIISVFLFAVLKLFIWFNQHLIERQKAYQNTRVGVTKFQEDFYNIPALGQPDPEHRRLNIFGEEQ